MDPSGGGGGAGAGAPWRRQGASGGGGMTSPSTLAAQSSTTSVPPAPPPAAAPSAGAPPPPPPLAPAGPIPPTRLNSEIGPRESKGPPLALAGAMMKDKKPFTYTPGKIDLSEIRNPRMARRLLINAHSEGVTSVPSSPGGLGGGPSSPSMYLPPAALAAMNPAMAIPVLPQGGFSLNRSTGPMQKPEFMRSAADKQIQQQHQQQQQPMASRVQRGQSPAAASVGLGDGSGNNLSASTTVPLSSFSSSSSSSSVGAGGGAGGDVNSRQSASQPYPGTNTYYGQQQEPQPPTTCARRSPSPSSIPSSYSTTAGPGAAGAGLRPTQSKAPAAPALGQNLGSIYNSGNEQRQSIFSDGPPTNNSPLFNASAPTPPPSESSSSSASVGLSKAPTPWMNSYSRNQPASSQAQDNNKDGGQDVNVTPWGTNAPPAPRIIPIARERADDSFHPHNSMAPTSAHKTLSSSDSGSHGAAPSSLAPPAPSPIPASSPANPFHTSSFAAASSQQESNVGAGWTPPRDDSNFRYGPTQSKAFKVIQQITDYVEEGSALPQQQQTTRAENSRSSVRSPTPQGGFTRTNFHPNPGPSAQDFSSSYPAETGIGSGVHFTNRMATGLPMKRTTTGLLPEALGTRQEPSEMVEPDDFLSGSIHALKMMRTPVNDEPSDSRDSAAGADQSSRVKLRKKLASRPPRPPCRSLSSTPTPSQSLHGKEGSPAPTPKAAFVRSRTVSPSPTPRPPNCTCSCNCTNNNNNNNSYNNNYYNQQQYAGSESESEDYMTSPAPRSYSPWPENFDPYDPYAYMQWYYWWYYNYGYPMGWNGGYEQMQQQQQQRSSTPNPQTATESPVTSSQPGMNYSGTTMTTRDSEQSDRNYHSEQEEQTEKETLQSLARNISSYKFGSEESSSADNNTHQRLNERRSVERQSSVPRIIVNKSPDPTNQPRLVQTPTTINDNSLSTSPRGFVNTGKASPIGYNSEQRPSREQSPHNNNGPYNTSFHRNESFDNKARSEQAFTSLSTGAVKRESSPETCSDYSRTKSPAGRMEQSSSDSINLHNEFYGSSGNKKLLRNNYEDTYGSSSDSRLYSGSSGGEEDYSRFESRGNESRRRMYDNSNNTSRSSMLDFSESNTSDCDSDAIQKSVVNKNYSYSQDGRKQESELVPSRDVRTSPKPQQVIRNPEQSVLLLPTAPLPPSSTSSSLSSSSELFNEREETNFDCPPVHNPAEEKGTNDYSDMDCREDRTSSENNYNSMEILNGPFREETMVVDEEEEDGSNSLRGCYVEDFQSSEDDVTLVDEAGFSPGVTIEECFSSEENTPDSGNNGQFPYPIRPPTRLSTIDEVTERSRTTFPPLDEEGESCSLDFQDDFQDTVEELSEDEEEDSNDENSSVSVIENKSDGHIDWGATTGGESHADEASTSSSSSSSSDAEDENDDDPLLPTVTVQLPLKLAFSKSTSFRDIPGVLVGDAKQTTTDVEEQQLEQHWSPTPREKFSFKGGNHEIEELSIEEDYSCDAAIGFVEETPTENEFSVIENCTIESEADDEPVVSFTISLSRSTSKSCGKKYEDDSECGDELEADQPETNVDISMDFEVRGGGGGGGGSGHHEEEVDFWGEIRKSASEDDDKSLSAEPQEPPRKGFQLDYWSDVRQGENKKEERVREEKEMDFWGEIEQRPSSRSQEQQQETKTENFWDRGRTFGTKAFSRQFSFHDDEVQEEPVKEEKLNTKPPQPPPKPNNKREDPHPKVTPQPQQEPAAPPNKPEFKFRTKSEERETKVTEEIEKDSEKTRIKINESSTETKSSQNKTKTTNGGETEEVVRLRNKEKTSTVKMDTIFSNRKLDDCDFSSSASTNTRYSLNESLLRSHRYNNKEENSDESSSTDCETKTSTSNNNNTNSNSHKEERYELKRTHSLTKKEINERNVEIRETRENFKVRPNSLNFEIQPNSFATTQKPPEKKPTEETINVAKLVEDSGLRLDTDRMTRAEDLLWRIERFLQESLSLGSEDDSGVMTDISRQISDVDTDNDVETEVVTLRSKPETQHNNNNSRSARALKTQSLIETTTASSAATETLEKQPQVDTSSVLLRNFSSEKKSLRYQRAKTHSRLFQLLQDECHKDEEDEEEEEDEEDTTESNPVLTEEIDFENLEEVEAAIEKQKFGRNKPGENRKATTIVDMSNKNEDMKSRTSRLTSTSPFPGDNKSLTSSTSVDSTSSSSGVLSPSSPISRDQLLVDIINGLSVTKRQKGSNFPSKIFKLLQQKFGEEFYDTFECCEDDFEFPPNPQSMAHHGSPAAALFESRLKLKNKLTSNSNSSTKKSSTLTSTQATITQEAGDEEKNKRSSWSISSNNKPDSSAEVDSADSKAKAQEFLQVPVRRKKTILNRDPRFPKTKSSTPT